MSPNPWRSVLRQPAFSIVEMVAVMAVLVMLSLAGLSAWLGTAAQSRAATMDVLVGLVEQARAAAITSRSDVVLAVAQPGDLPAGDGRCRCGWFQVASWPDAAAIGPPTVVGVQMSRWRPLDAGIVLLGGSVDGLDNPMDAPPLTILAGPGESNPLTVHALVFDPRGGLRYPGGSTPVVMRLAEGGYRGGLAAPSRRSTVTGVSESRLKIGRVTGHSYRID